MIIGRSTACSSKNQTHTQRTSDRNRPCRSRSSSRRGPKPHRRSPRPSRTASWPSTPKPSSKLKPSKRSRSLPFFSYTYHEIDTRFVVQRSIMRNIVNLLERMNIIPSGLLIGTILTSKFC